jgi:hypothetical protein
VSANVLSDVTHAPKQVDDLAMLFGHDLDDLRYGKRQDKRHGPFVPEPRTVRGDLMRDGRERSFRDNTKQTKPGDVVIEHRVVPLGRDRRRW